MFILADLVVCIVSGILMFVADSMKENAHGQALSDAITFGGVSALIFLISLAILIIYFITHPAPKSDSEVAKIMMEKRDAELSQKSNVPWDKRYFTQPCPYCSHYKVRYSTWDDKKMSVAFWGVWSDKVGKSFKCDNCGRVFNN